jgi:DNA mismatch repair protein MutL
MSKIRVLPEILANKIAAGEIVERPASVVKELLENSIDAGARSVELRIESGGKRLIQVRDDGSGMTQDDAILAFEHHATSKIQRAEDLANIATLGFRGEALPSIASISRLILKTRFEGAEATSAGTEIEIQGGIMRSVKATAWDRGSEVTVRDLFFNVPARRKFLRSNETELGHVTRLVTHYALAHPEMRFRLLSEDRTLIDAAATGTVRERIYQLFGEGFLENLVELSGQSGMTRVSGFTSKPHEQRTNPYSQFFYVNRRMVRDKVITSGVRQAYRNVIPSSAYPVALLFVELPFDEVDVNAHPAKIEIRFRQQSQVHDLIRDTIQRALVQGKSIPVYEHRPDSWGTPRNSFESASAGYSWQNHPEGTPPLELTSPVALPDPFQRAFNYPFRETPFAAVPGAADHSGMQVRAEMLLGAPSDSIQPFHSAGIRILGQIQESYIVACDNLGLLIVDQHVAHERILYEKLAEAIQRSEVEIQGLLVPLTLELAPHQMATLERILPELNKDGFQVEKFGGNTFLIRSVPAIARSEDCRQLITEILDGIDSEDRTLDLARIRDRIAVNTACRSAIKVHTPLTMEKMQWLLDELSRTRIPTNCPHGRPIILRFSLYEIERNFRRI